MTGLLDVAERVWPVLLFLALIQVVADLCDDAGLFDVSAHVAARVAGGNRLRLFLLFTLLATVCTWVLSIDTTAVLLAPIGLALAGGARARGAAVRVRVGVAGQRREPAAAGVQPDQPARPVTPRRGRGRLRPRDLASPARGARGRGRGAAAPAPGRAARVVRRPAGAAVARPRAALDGNRSRRGHRARDRRRRRGLGGRTGRIGGARRRLRRTPPLRRPPGTAGRGWCRGR